MKQIFVLKQIYINNYIKENYRHYSRSNLAGTYGLQSWLTFRRFTNEAPQFCARNIIPHFRVSFSIIFDTILIAFSAIWLLWCPVLKLKRRQIRPEKLLVWKKKNDFLLQQELQLQSNHYLVRVLVWRRILIFE